MPVTGGAIAQLLDNFNKMNDTSSSQQFPDFNLKPFPTSSDEFGKYTNEPILMGIMNHLHITAGGMGGMLGDPGVSIIDMNGIPDRDAATVARGVYIARGLSTRMGISIMQACGIAGYCSKESSCKPTSVNKAEKAGTSSISTNYANSPGSYGAGIAQWTGAESKAKNLARIGLPAGTPIESLTMDQQLDLYAKGTMGDDLRRFKIETAMTLDAATALACIIGHGISAAIKAYDEAGNDINNQTYIQACMSKYKPFPSGPRRDIPKARKFAQQCFDACARGEMGSPS